MSSERASLGKRLATLSFLLLGMVGGSAAATQYLARGFEYAPQLGRPLVAWGRSPGVKLYPPFHWYFWSRRWQEAAPKPFAIASGIAMAGALLGLGVAMRLGRKSRQPDASGAYGTARWSNRDELARAGLLSDTGIVLCQTDDARFKRKGGGWATAKAGRLVRHDGPEHTLVFAPPRSGKGVGVVVPTLLAWTGSVIVYDIKRENWEITAGWRSQFSHCLRFEPTAEHSVRFNPLMEVRPSPLDVRDAQNIAEILVNPDTTEEQRDHWKLTGHAFLVAVILHVLYAEENKSLAGVLELLTDPSRHLVELLSLMLETRHLPEGPHPAVAGGAREMLNRSENERSGVLSTAISFLALYRDPLIAENTRTSDFSIADLMCARRPVSLYLVVPPSDFDRTRPVMRLLLNFFGRRLTEYLESVDGPGGRREKKHRLLYLIDEFPSLGRMPFFVTSLAFLPGYRIKCLLIAQSLNQLDQAYGQNNPILDNCHVRLTYGANDERTARRISDLLGQASLMRTQIGESRREGFFSPVQVSRSYQEYGRMLKTTDELLSLPYPEAVLMVGNIRPYLAKKVLFYDDARFAGRSSSDEKGGRVPPDSPQAQDAELPPRIAAPHWLSLSPPAREAASAASSASSGAAAAPEEAPRASTSAGSGEPPPPSSAEPVGEYWDFLAVDDADPGDPQVGTEDSTKSP